jgi:hypothetical protein
MAALSWPCSARLEVIAMIVQPTVSSMMAEASSVIPTLRRMNFISRRTVATILTEATDSAAPRNNAVINRCSARGTIESGSNSPTATPTTIGRTIRATETLIAGRLALLTSLRSVSMPVSSNSISIPRSDTASSIARCSRPAGKSACCPSGQTAPKTDGPNKTPRAQQARPFLGSDIRF